MKSNDNLLLALGLASFVVFPFAALPGIILGRRHGVSSRRGRTGFVLCWIAMALFAIHLAYVIVILIGQSIG